MISRKLIVVLFAASVGIGSSMNAMSSEVSSDNAPRFLKYAEMAVEGGNPERVVGMLVPRFNMLRKESHRHRAYAALCNAHLKQLDLRSAKVACSNAVESNYVSASDYNNLGVFYYLAEDFDLALSYFERATEVEPSLDFEHNLDAAIAAVESR